MNDSCISGLSHSYSLCMHIFAKTFRVITLLKIILITSIFFQVGNIGLKRSKVQKEIQ
jgi:hypothetical protein